MGCCSSKPNTSSTPQNPHLQDEPRIENNISSDKLSAETANRQGKVQSEEKLGFKKKELFVIQHRRSHDRRSDPKASEEDSDRSSIQPANLPDPETPATATNTMALAANGAAVRTSSCTKEEVDAILIQCGRLSRSSSGSARKYSGSKRSHDFDRENGVSTELNCDNNGDIDDDNERPMRRHSRGSHRRRTPSRSRERDPQGQRSGGGSRRSPGRRSKSPVTKSGNLANSATSNSNGGIRAGKMVSVPATVSIEKKNNMGDCNGVKEASFSRKAEHSPYRRAPLNEIDMGSLPFQPLANSVKGQHKCSEIEEVVAKQPVNVVTQGVDVNNAKVAVQGCRSRGSEVKDIAQIKCCGVNENQRTKLPLTLTRSRSSTLRSRDLDINIEALLKPSPATNYNLLLLEDIQNFHQKTNGVRTLPECLSKDDDLIEASMHKYVTVRKRGSGFESFQGGGDSDELDSYTSGSRHHCASSSSADSTDRWTSTRHS